MGPPILKKEIIDLIRRQLGDMANLPGAVFYNGWQTLRPGKVYIMGLNPGGEPSEESYSILESMERLGESECAYLDECWGTKGRSYERGRAPHQKRVVELARALGSDIRKTFAANAVFASGKRSDLPALWERCWPVHQRFLQIVRPAVILCLGNGDGLSSFFFLRGKAKATAEIKLVGASYRDGKSFAATFRTAGSSALSCTVFGAPHPSWVEPTAPLKKFLADLVKVPVGEQLPGSR